MTTDAIDRTHALELASLLCSRLCHDLLSPVGALSNGLELLAEEKDPAMRERCFELLEQSARTSADKLKYYRLAFGAAGLATVSLLLLSWGWARAPAHRLLPVEYSAFLWSAAMGWLWFGEAVSAATLLGAGLIVAGCWHGSSGRRTAASGEHIEQTAL